MKVGLVSDTHGQQTHTERAVRILEDRDVDLLIHCGDVTRVKHLSPFLGMDVHIHVVMGNMDRREREFRDVSETGAFTMHGSDGELTVVENTICFTHGHMDSSIRSLRERADYLVHGHTHERKDSQWNECRIINPGSVKPPNSSIAILKPSRDELTFYSLDN